MASQFSRTSRDRPRLVYPRLPSARSVQFAEALRVALGVQADRPSRPNRPAVQVLLRFVARDRKALPHFALVRQATAVTDAERRCG